MFDWHITINDSFTAIIAADTYMEAELDARIQFGTKARLTIVQIEETKE